MNSTQELPLVTVILPIRNEADFIENTVKSVIENDYPHDKLEILVIDGMSDDGTREIIEKLAAVDDRIKLLDNPRRIIPTALNIGVKACRGDLYIRVDGHAELTPDFISNSISQIQQHPDAWIVGGYIDTIGTNYIGKATAAAMRSPIGVGNARFRLGEYEGYVDTLAFGTHHMWIFDKVGYFDEDMMINEDDDFNLRITLAGGKIWMSNSIRSTYYARGSLKKLATQYWRYGFWRIRTMQKHKKTASFRQMIPLLFVSSLIILGLTGIIWQPVWYLLAAELGLYVLGLIAGATGVGKKSGWRFAPLSPIIFVILHLSYGIGCLWGIVRFILLRGRGIKKLERMKLSR